jgi:hypothetical protein
MCECVCGCGGLVSLVNLGLQECGNESVRVLSLFIDWACEAQAPGRANLGNGSYAAGTPTEGLGRGGASGQQGYGSFGTTGCAARRLGSLSILFYFCRELEQRVLSSSQAAIRACGLLLLSLLLLPSGSPV